MYLRTTQRRRKDGSIVRYLALAENVWNAQTGRAEAQVVYNFGRADAQTEAQLNRLVRSIKRVLGEDTAEDAGADGGPNIAIEESRDLGVVHVARALWDELGIAAAVREVLEAKGLGAQHHTALFAMAANRLEEPRSKRGCTTRWLGDRAWLPDAQELNVDHLYRALDVLAGSAEQIERRVFFQTADLFSLDADLIFYDTTTAYCEVDAPDEAETEWNGQPYPALRRRGHSKEGRDNQPQVIVALAVTRDGMPIRSWVLPGDTADVSTVRQIKEDLRSWNLGRCVFVGDAGMYSKANLKALSEGLGRYIVAVPMASVKEAQQDALTRPGRYRQIAGNLKAKEVWVGDGERRRRYVVCLNPEEAERQRQHRNEVLTELESELARIDRGEADHPKAACRLLSSARYGRYLKTDSKGRPRLDRPKIKAAEQQDGKFVVVTNDDSLSVEDVALGYKGAAIIESCFRKMKQTGLEVRPMYHVAARRITAHVKLCVLALQIQRAAEMRCGRTWTAIAQVLGRLKVVRYRSEKRAIVQRTEISGELAQTLRQLRVQAPPRLLSVTELGDAA
ncbi:transposase [Rhodovibrio sodomensis]|uniref:Transposase n=1 Tax=Rhodovibrio sodomensis TaxID=1088 RepID=A0ABS1DQ76_9PROT|nr:transposase [Rhodovibrio sodomensis]